MVQCGTEQSCLQLLGTGNPFISSICCSICTRNWSLTFRYLTALILFVMLICKWIHREFRFVANRINNQLKDCWALRKMEMPKESKFEAEGVAFRIPKSQAQKASSTKGGKYIEKKLPRFPKCSNCISFAQHQRDIIKMISVYTVHTYSNV